MEGELYCFRGTRAGGLTHLEQHHQMSPGQSTAASWMVEVLEVNREILLEKPC